MVQHAADSLLHALDPLAHRPARPARPPARMCELVVRAGQSHDPWSLLTEPRRTAHTDAETTAYE
ncbi:hypothetical protein [Streptomyces sp. NPDC058985]|uniref:hypothetical protein n=1 Tax=Streptomyces sp. NPDC058985 TaxID=3346684 RepID=UPI0036CDBE44